MVSSSYDQFGQRKNHHETLDSFVSCATENRLTSIPSRVIGAVTRQGSRLWAVGNVITPLDSRADHSQVQAWHTTRLIAIWYYSPQFVFCQNVHW